MLLSHTAGLAAIRERSRWIPLYDWDRYVAAIAAQTPWWKPGSANGYHAVTFGHLIGELIGASRARAWGSSCVTR